MAFIDEVTLDITAGKGGDGIVAWRQEKYIDKGGPAGGNGGRGGDVFITAVRDASYLQNYQHKREFAADNGESGRKNKEEGKNGESLTLKFPIGSVVTNTETGDTYELLTEGQTELILRGGKGGLGNDHFKSSTNTTPYESTPGRAGESGTFHIELRLIADVGLIGLPSAGKSTLLNSLTNAHSKTAEYHFTTLEPHLGVMPGGYVLADIPGLIQGASQGKGLGYKFLRHIRRTKVLVHLVSLESDDVVADYQGIRTELEKYDPSLIQKPEIIVLSKTDVRTADQVVQAEKDMKLVAGDTPVLTLTAFDDDSIKAFSDYLANFLENQYNN